MLEKVEWNYAQFKADPIDYRLADFFISACHVEDYFEITLGKSKWSVIKSALNKDELRDFRLCKDLCNVAKHYELNRGRVSPSTFTLTGEICGAEIGVLDVGAGDKWVMTTAQNQEIDVIWLADRVMQKWRELFAKNGL